MFQSPTKVKSMGCLAFGVGASRKARLIPPAEKAKPSNEPTSFEFVRLRTSKTVYHGFGSDKYISRLTHSTTPPK